MTILFYCIICRRGIGTNGVGDAIGNELTGDESDDDGDAAGRFMTGRFIIVLVFITICVVLPTLCDGEGQERRPARGGVLLAADKFNIKQGCVT